MGVVIMKYRYISNINLNFIETRELMKFNWSIIFTDQLNGMRVIFFRKYSEDGELFEVE